MAYPVLAASGTALLSPTAPTDDQIKALYEKDPAKVFEMVRKLWGIENTPVAFELPAMQVVMATDFSAKVLWAGPATVSIGKDPYEHTYTFKLVEGPIKVAYNPPAPPPWGWIIGGSFTVGVIATVIVEAFMGR